jgi:hypothetical protein
MSLREILATEPAILPPHLAELTGVLPPDLRSLVDALPLWLVEVAAEAPVYVGRRAGAALLTQYVTPVSPRTLEVWPVPWWHVDNRAITLLIVLLAVGYAKLISAPMIMGGRRSAADIGSQNTRPEIDHDVPEDSCQSISPRNGNVREKEARRQALKFGVPPVP